MVSRFRRVSLRILFFRIFYSTSYTILLLITLVALVVTPIDTIYQSIRLLHQIPNTFIIGGTYLCTGVITLLIYSSRIYTNWRVLNDIPKTYIPIEKGEVGKSVYRMIHKGLERSAIIAWDSRPQELSNDTTEKQEERSRSKTAERLQATFRRKGDGKQKTVIEIDPADPPWGTISHPGWGPPSSVEFANVVYSAVILELPNLIEAKAVSLAPLDPAFAATQPEDEITPVLPDSRVVEVLQRPAAMGLREYLAHLSRMGLINPPALGASFLSQYEYARYSPNLLKETQFWRLMDTFASILDGMTEVDLSVLAEIHARTEHVDVESLAPSSITASSDNGSAIHHRSAHPSSQLHHSRTPSPASSVVRNAGVGISPTAPSRLRNPSAGKLSDPSRPPKVSQQLSQRSESSSSSSRSAQSVIRHGPAGEPRSSYEYKVAGT